jgi:Fe-S cluster biogenesis protein NfuA
MHTEKYEHTHEHTREERIRGLIDQLDAYIAQFHGGRVEFCGLEGNIVLVRMGGACEKCPLQPATLKGWVEGTLRQFFPEIEKVENCE